MPGPEDPQDADIEEVSSSLSEGLRTCRSVVNSYRVLLVGDQPDVSRQDEIPPAVDDVPSSGLTVETIETSSN